VVYDDVVYVPTRVRPLIAFRAGGRGDISQSHKLWSLMNGPDVPTPVTDGKYFYSVVLIRKMFAACEDFWGAWLGSNGCELSCGRGELGKGGS
jgi:hypothetical protein